jgi:hypothetical protein
MNTVGELVLHGAGVFLMLEGMADLWYWYTRPTRRLFQCGRFGRVVAGFLILLVSFLWGLNSYGWNSEEDAADPGPLMIGYAVAWTPNKKHEKHGLIEESSKTIFLFDIDECEAWLTFEHEIIELRLKAVSNVYREMLNALIEAFERLAHKRKEQFLASLPEITKIIEESRKRWPFQPRLSAFC